MSVVQNPHSSHPLPDHLHCYPVEKENHSSIIAGIVGLIPAYLFGYDVYITFPLRQEGHTAAPTDPADGPVNSLHFSLQPAKNTSFKITPPCPPAQHSQPTPSPLLR
ncbi:Proteolipid protein 2 [Manis javanica]|nr:Proteolipid protein 2 [Manis javanica]